MIKKNIFNAFGITDMTKTAFIFVVDITTDDITVNVVNNNH